jgi:predicted aspartyl protease
MSTVRASVKIGGLKTTSSSLALIDTGAKMTVLDSELANKVGVEYTGRKITFISISGQAFEASEATIRELVVDGETLKYEAVAVGKIPERVKETLTESDLDPNMIIGLLTLGRANLLPDIATGRLRKVESFIL